MFRQRMLLWILFETSDPLISMANSLSVANVNGWRSRPTYLELLRIAQRGADGVVRLVFSQGTFPRLVLVPQSLGTISLLKHELAHLKIK
jgi:hypothetical protein